VEAGELTGSRRLIVGNLDCETEYARRRGLRARPASRAALLAASALATLLRAFAENEGDLLWTPLPVDPARVLRVPGLPRPRLVSGPIEELEDPGEVLAWGRITDAATAANHRGFALDVATRLGTVLPGTRLVSSVEDLAGHLGAGGAAAAPGDRWVVKAPYSAAGRLRVFGAGAHVAERDFRRIAGLLDRYGQLLFEPWMDRTTDYGVAGRVEADGVVLGPVHRQVPDDRGRFRGIASGGVDPEVEWAVLDAARFAGANLVMQGYRGPYGIDAWGYRTADGDPGLNPLGELNARHTFGHVARKLFAHLGLDGPATLRVGKGPPPGRAVALLAPGGEDGISAWIETPDA
jgi:hypothetical protein